MSLEERAREAEDESQRPSVASRFAPWFILGIAAVVVLEAFAHPLLAASVLCLKFAFNDLLTAHWLLRTDPDRARGWTCALLYAAVGFWKAAVINYGLFTAAIVYTLVTGQPAWPQRPANAPPPDFLDDPITPWAGPTVFWHAVEFVLGMVALALAYAHRQKLWLSPRIHLARKLGVWPPTDDRGINWLATRPAATVTALVVLIWAIGFAPLVLIAPPPAVNAQEWQEVIFALHSGFALFLTLPVILVSACVQDKTNRYLLAHTPEECWGEPAGERPGDRTHDLGCSN
jgi:hypothetical protein